MKQNFNAVECARILYNEYSTFCNDEIIEKKIYNILGDKVFSEQVQEKKPRQFLNDFILRYYPNEMSIKSNFINNVLFKEKNHVSIFELKAGKSRVDLCKINGISTAFEIKTDFDTIHRLHQQMTDYFEIFEKVYLICPESKVKKMEQYIPDNCGIYCYYITNTGKYRFKRIKKAIYSEYISSKSQLLMLTKKDLNNYFGCSSLSDKDEMFSFIINHYSKAQINTIFKKCIREKYSSQWSFIVENKDHILEIDYQWFFKHQISPRIVYL